MTVSARPPVTLQPFLPVHLELLSGWLRQPHVARWYPHPDENMAWAASPPAGGFQAIIACRALEVGYLRWQHVDRDTLDSLGLFEIPANAVDADILLGDTVHVGRGIGPDALEALAAELARDASVPMLGLTTELENTSAHRAFEQAGFQIARQYMRLRGSACATSCSGSCADLSLARPERQDGCRGTAASWLSTVFARAPQSLDSRGARRAATVHESAQTGHPTVRFCDDPIPSCAARCDGATEVI